MQLVSNLKYDRRIEILCRTATRLQPPAPLGIHHILELYGCSAEALNDASLLSEVMEKAAALSNTKLLYNLVYSFPNQGVTALALLAESHIAIHTWPEHGYAAVDLFACGQRARPEAGCAYLIQALQARRHRLHTIRRGQAHDVRFPDFPVEENSAPDLRDTVQKGAFGHDFVTAGFQTMDE